MAALKGIIFALVIVLGSANDLLVPPSICALDNARYLPIYDLENTTYNVLGHDEIMRSFSKDGFYQFKDVQSQLFGGMFYGAYPVLVVYQVDEATPELHGYYFRSPWGLQTIYDSELFGDKISADFKHFWDYLNSPIDKEGYTPSAALQIYPEFENMKLTKIVKSPSENVDSRGFALLFLLPKKEHLKPNNFDQKFNIFEEFYYNGTEICQVKAEPENEVQNAGVLARKNWFEADSEDLEDENEDDIDPLLTVYDRDPEGHGQNVANLDLINEYYSKNDFYKFENFEKEWLPYDEYPILVVIQPDEKLGELHGYYFDNGILSLVSYIQDNPEFENEYRPFFEYLDKEPDLDGLTPDAARYDYPYFLDYEMTRFVHAENVADQFGVLFLAPARHRPANFLHKYNVLENYGIGPEYIVEYVV